MKNIGDVINFLVKYSISIIMKKYIKIKGTEYRVVKDYVKDGRHWVRYKDADIDKGVLNFIGVERAYREIEVDSCVRWDYRCINWYNPLTYIILSVFVFIGIIRFGIEGVKNDNGLKPIRDNQRWFKKGDIEYKGAE